MMLSKITRRVYAPSPAQQARPPRKPNDALQIKNAVGGVRTRTHKPRSKPCRRQQLELLTIFSSKEKSSTSDTVIAIGQNLYAQTWPTQHLQSILREPTLAPTLIYKFSFGGDAPKNNSLYLERLTYARIVAPLIHTHICPHFLLPLANYTCGHMHLLEALSTTARKNLLAKLAKDHTKHVATLVHVLALERSQNITLDSFLTIPFASKAAAEYNLACVFFQLMYTTACMHLNGIRHNDLHGGNVFIDKLPKPQCIVYRIPAQLAGEREDHVVQIKTPYVVKVYDFDRVGSTVESSALHARNLMLDFWLCKSFGECNHPNESFDVYTLLQQFIPHFREKNMQSLVALVYKVFPDFDNVSRLQTFTKYPHYICSRTRTYQNRKKLITECGGDYLLTHAQMLSSIDILKETGKLFQAPKASADAVVCTMKRINTDVYDREYDDIDTVADAKRKPYAMM